jgi:hypothetical protein
MGLFLWKVGFKMITDISYNQADELMEKLSTPKDIYLVIDKEDLKDLPKDLAEEIKKAMGDDDVIIVAIA